MLGFKFLGNTHVPHRKNTANMPAVKMPPPDEVLLPMGGQIGAPSKPIVKAGDTVKVGQLVAEAGGYVSNVVHAPISGKVVKVEPYLCPNGQTVDAIRIQSDGLMTVHEDVKPPVITDLDSFIEAVRASGVLGLGGAGFPTAVKLDALKKGNIDTIVINAAECEPYITSDTRTMIDRTSAVVDGVALIKTYAPTVIFATTTVPTPDCIGDQDYDRIMAFNKAAIEALEPMGVIINDIFPMVYGHTDEMICDDKLHLSEVGAKTIAARVADVIRDAVSE